MVTEDQVRDALSEVIDPEIGINIVDLGLVYDVRIDAGHVEVDFMVTTPLCPLGPYLVRAVESRLLALPGVASAEARVVLHPPWDPSLMSDEARRLLGRAG
jgi:metal-sulfur cluster biosynthetic enzyme